MGTINHLQKLATGLPMATSASKWTVCINYMPVVAVCVCLDVNM